MDRAIFTFILVDYDRCFFFDEKGTFIEGYYIVGLLAKSILKKAKLNLEKLAEKDISPGILLTEEEKYGIIRWFV